MTPRLPTRSRIFAGLIFATISLGCGTPSEAAPGPAPAPPPAAPETCLGVTDRGLWSDLDSQIQLALPATTPAHVTARIDDAHHVLILAIDGVARKAYPLGGPARLTVGGQTLALRPGDRAELAPLLTAEHLATGAAKHDRDGDGLPDALDLLIGAKKTVANADAYTPEAEGYITLR